MNSHFFFQPIRSFFIFSCMYIHILERDTIFSTVLALLILFVYIHQLIMQKKLVYQSLNSSLILTSWSNEELKIEREEQTSITYMRMVYLLARQEKKKKRIKTKILNKGKLLKLSSLLQGYDWGRGAKGYTTHFLHR